MDVQGEKGTKQAKGEGKGRGLVLAEDLELGRPELGRENLLNLRQVGSEGVHQQGEKGRERGLGEEGRGSEPQPGRDSENEGSA